MESFIKHSANAAFGMGDEEAKRNDQKVVEALIEIAAE
jgi:hypothetical protein